AGETAKPDQPIQLVFDRAMDKTAVESAFQVYPAVKGQLAWQDDRTLVFTPAEKLARAGLYDVVLDQRARDAQGAPLNQAYQFRFATAGFLDVAQVIPAPSTADAEPGSTITVIFNRPVVALTNLDAQKDFPQPVSLTANGQTVAGAGEWLNTSIYVFKPAQPLPGGTIITAKVGATPGGRPLVDTDNNPLAADYVWQFAVIPPRVVYVTPNNGAAQVPIESPIVVQFNQPISLDSARDHVSLTSSNGQSVPLNFDVLSETLTVTPTNRLEFETAYVIKITAGLTGRSGGSGMRETVNALFTTVPLPKIVSTDPKDGQRDAYSYTGFTIHFNTTMNHDTVMAHLSFNPPLSPTQVYTYSSGDTFGMNFGAQPSTDYEVKITPGIEDPYGNKTQEALTVHFRTADLEPNVSIHVPNYVGTYNGYDPTRVYVVNTNIKTLDLRLYRLSADRFPTAQNYGYDTSLPTGDLVRQWSQPVEAPLNKIQATRLDMAADGGALAPGLYLLDVNSPQLKPNAGAYNQRHVLVVSRNNVTLKAAQSGALAWVTDYRSGQPVPNVPLTFFGSDGKQFSTVTTDAQGLAATKDSGVIGAFALEPFTGASTDWSSGISMYDFGLNGNYGYADQYRGYLYTDRPIYRP
ncbi:MAG TPA: Ig-like domain-containing protein, partial [Anaerolineae bacterium]|nr:Ig-like domain-containing protein [Anaerolineae bacterium]